jgi:hypothetical protein
MTNSNAEHRLFHVLVLMGGGLALSCGGAVSVQGNPDGSAAGAARTPGQQGTAGAVSSTGGSGVAGASWATAGAVSTNTGGAGLASAGASSQSDTSGPGVDAGLASLPCSPEQWDCTAVLGHCGAQLYGADLPAGCFCAPQRPRSATDCAADETLVCVQAYQSATGTNLRIQCACVPTSVTDSPTQCTAYCDKNWHSDPTPFPPTACVRPSPITCTDQGVCTATAADVLRQEGILCGCADIGLK